MCLENYFPDSEVERPEEISRVKITPRTEWNAGLRPGLLRGSRFEQGGKPALRRGVPITSFGAQEIHDTHDYSSSVRRISNQDSSRPVRLSRTPFFKLAR